MSNIKQLSLVLRQQTYALQYVVESPVISKSLQPNTVTSPYTQYN